MNWKHENIHGFGRRVCSKQTNNLFKVEHGFASAADFSAEPVDMFSRSITDWVVSQSTLLTTLLSTSASAPSPDSV
jgi:hypothetical protein